MPRRLDRPDRNVSPPTEVITPIDPPVTQIPRTRPRDHTDDFLNRWQRMDRTRPSQWRHEALKRPGPSQWFARGFWTTCGALTAILLCFVLLAIGYGARL